MLPSNATIDFVEASDVLGPDRLSCIVSQPARKVFDSTETVAAKSEVISTASRPSISEVKRLFSMQRTSRIWRALARYKLPHVGG